jgi:hypothetical protein
MIRWSEVGDDDSAEGGVNESVHTVAARLLMFAKLSGHGIPTTPPKVVAVVQSLSKYNPQPDSLLTFALGDIINREPIVVDVDAIASTAFVLPCIKHPTEQFPTDLNNANYFLVMPPRVDWKNIGWED